MTITEVYDYTRLFYFCWAALLFFIMVYYGVLDIIYTQSCSHGYIYPEHQLWAGSTLGAIVVYLLSVPEIFLDNIMGGYRVFLPGLVFIPASIAVHWGRARIITHAKAVRMGACK